ncbi:Cysteine proteinase, putative [Hondaea fermentalgiana]|uniref:Cysteine proteinase, putative n=1 Tax=Hondaea fermentalgiana TaxID=2315210 RepID=A0A2R5GPW1_9STRA|nr:Cysteine proteinase, putative [Hondaea fermentalgiana]|eukprot:GBG32645.1 Cysteine proteinase, putative [Hondaea fermentalgiana]
MDCSRNSINQACSGGNQLTAIAGWSGNFYTEEEFPYILSSSGQSSRADAAESDDFCSETYTRQGVFALNESASIMSVSPRTEDALLEALQIGPVSVASAGYNNAFLTYTGGVLDDEACDSDDVVDHALLIVGYGTTDDGVDYYIAKNSWGPAWGEDGYVRLARNVRSDSRPYGACNILYQADYLEPYAVTCGLAYNAPCSTYANEEFCTVETGCQSSKYFAANYAFDASSIDSSGSSSSDKDGIYIGVSVSLGLLIIIGVVLFLRKMRREDREDRLEASKLAAFKDVFRRSISSASTMASKRSGGLTSAQGYLDAAEREDEEAAQRRDRYGHKLSEFRRRLQAAQGRRLGAVASQDDLLLLYLEEHRGNLDAAVVDFIDRES